MYNAKPIIATALSTDGSLIALIPKVRMFEGSGVFNSTTVFPYLTYEEIANVESVHADDEEIVSSVTFRIHIWSMTNTSTMAGHVNRIMKTIGFGRNFAMDEDDALENGTILKHKIMSYSNKYEL